MGSHTGHLLHTGGGQGFAQPTLTPELTRLRRLAFASLFAGGASFNLETLKLLKTAFDDADIDGSGALDEEEFIQAFQSVGSLSMYKSAQELGNLFRKIDANSDGTVDWDEFTNHILLEQ